jgi:PilZ domain
MNKFEFEKRKMERFLLEVPATLKIKGNSTGHREAEVSVRTKDVCAGGAFLITDCEIEERAAVEIDLLLTFGRACSDRQKHSHVKVTGRVLRSDGNGVAIEFDSNYKISSVQPETVQNNGG